MDSFAERTFGTLGQTLHKVKSKRGTKDHIRTEKSAKQKEQDNVNNIYLPYMLQLYQNNLYRLGGGPFKFPRIRSQI